MTLLRHIRINGMNIFRNNFFEMPWSTYRILSLVKIEGIFNTFINLT